MAAHLDHLIIPAKDKAAAAARLAQILGVRAAPATVGPFHAVHVNDGLTIDFDQWDGDIPQGHYCFRVPDSEFDAVLERLQLLRIDYRSLPHGPADNSINVSVGGRIVYWSEPDGHVWELLTQSYAREKTA